MKIDKVVFGTLFFCVMICLSNTSMAIDEQKTFIDSQEDVILTDLIEGNATITGDKPNIDIIKLSYNHEDGSNEASISIEVAGKIENKGGITEFELFNSVLYTIELSTSEQMYTILYANKTCQVNSENISDWTVNNGILTINFPLSNSNEIFEDIYVQTLDMDIDLTTFTGGLYTDTYPDEAFLIADANGPYEGKVGETIEFTGDVFDIYDLSDTYSYNWDFGDGTSSNKQNPRHQYDSADEYIITLNVEDEFGNIANTTTTVSITEEDNNGNGNTNGNGNNQNGSESGLNLFITIIAVIIIIGILVLIFIIRR
jgi:preprotein translocase subunit SecG